MSLTATFAESAAEGTIPPSVNQQHIKEQEAHMDRANLSGMGEYAVRQTARVGQAGASSDEKKKQEEADRRIIQTELNRQHDQMVAQLKEQLDKTQAAYDKKAREVAQLKTQENDLLLYQQLVASGQIDNPAHQELKERVEARHEELKGKENTPLEDRLALIKSAHTEATAKRLEAESELQQEEIRLNELKSAYNDLKAARGNPEKIQEMHDRLVDMGIRDADSNANDIRGMRSEIQERQRLTTNSIDKQQNSVTALGNEEVEVSNFMKQYAQWEQGTISTEEMKYHAQNMSEGAQSNLPETPEIIELLKPSTDTTEVTNNNAPQQEPVQTTTPIAPH